MAEIRYYRRKCTPTFGAHFSVAPYIKKRKGSNGVQERPRFYLPCISNNMRMAASALDWSSYRKCPQSRLIIVSVSSLLEINVKGRESMIVKKLHQSIYAVRHETERVLRNAVIKTGNSTNKYEEILDACDICTSV